MTRKVGAGVLLLHRGKLGLLLRDNNPNIPNPDKWALPGGTQDPGECLLRTAMRELWEELRIYPTVKMLGVTVRGNAICFSKPSDAWMRRLRKGPEGQRFQLFRFDELNSLSLGGEIRSLHEEYRNIIIGMMVYGEPPDRRCLGLKQWKGQ